jgi:hypothetical protein
MSGGLGGGSRPETWPAELTMTYSHSRPSLVEELESIGLEIRVVDSHCSVVNSDGDELVRPRSSGPGTASAGFHLLCETKASLKENLNHVWVEL